MVLMTNSMLATLNNSALKISLKDKHVGYVLYFTQGVPCPLFTVRFRLPRPGYYFVTPFRRRVKLPRVLAAEVCPVSSVQMSRSDKLKVELFGSRCEAALATHVLLVPPWKIRFNCANEVPSATTLS